MMTGLAASRAYAQAQAHKKEVDRIIASFASNPNKSHRATTKVTQRILLNGPYLLNGRYWEIKSKSLGAGVYKLTAEKA